MKALLEPSRYFAPEAFERERGGLFSRTWAYAGLASDLRRRGDYFLASVAGKELIVRKSAAGPRAFLNTCSHRHARLCAVERGRGRLVCPYHGWGYDDEGTPTTIPAREEFAGVRADPRAHGLASYEVAAAGTFLFVRLRAGGPGLEPWLGPAFDLLERVSESLDRELDAFREDFDCDWKILIENALESYHVPIVHRASLGDLPEYGESSSLRLFKNGHSLGEQRAQAALLARWAAFEPAVGSRRMASDGYRHLHVFPNLTVTSFMGLSFHIQRCEPLGPERCALSTRSFASRCEGGSAQGALLLEGLFREGIASSRRVVAEDKRICESVQLGVRQAERSAVLAESRERRLAHFQAEYLRALAPARRAGGCAP